MYAETADTASLIAYLRHARGWLRCMALLVTVTFAMLILAPTAAAAREEYERSQQDAALATSDESELARTLQRIEVRLAHLVKKLAKRLDAVQDADDLAALRKKIERLDARIDKRFGKIEQHLLERDLPVVILERHRKMVATYRTELAALSSNLEAAAQESDIGARTEMLERVRARLAGKKHKRSQQPFDPNELPTRTLRPDADNKPRTAPEAFRQSGLFDTPFVKLAAVDGYLLDGLPGADDPAYRAASDEVVLTPAIVAKAAELGNDPVAIYHWVRNRIEWQPGWGAVQDAQLTLQAGRGNAMDISGLLIALLRAAGIPARYAHGTIEVSEAQFRNWAGGFDSINAATNYAASGGIPITTVSSGGRIAKVRLEHVWVQAAVDFHPSRGAKNRAADAWVSLDPSFKQYEFSEGLDAIAIAGIDPEQLAQSFLDSGTVDEDQGWVSGFDSAVLADAQQQAQSRLEHYIAENLDDPTVGDVIGGRRTIVQEFPVLPSALANRVVAVGATYDRVPHSLQQRVSWSLGTSDTPVSFPWARVNNRKVTLSFRPATDADEQTLQSLLPEGEVTDPNQLPRSIPAYLIEVVPELKLDGEVVAAAAPMTLGEDLNLVTRVTYPTTSVPAHTQTVVAGSFLVVNAVAANVAVPVLEALRTRLEATRDVLETLDPAQYATLTREDLLGDLFQAGSLGYFAQLIGLAHIAGLQSGGQFRLGAGLGTIGYEPDVSYLFGIPRAIEPGGVALDTPMHMISAVDGTDVERQRQFNLQLGLLSSALEHTVPEQMFGTEEQPADAISTVRALQKANAQGQRIYHVTPENMNTTLPNIGHDAATMDEIRMALTVGREVITHTAAVSVPGWSGAGYVIIDPQTGVGAWKIGGGVNGGYQFLPGQNILDLLRTLVETFLETTDSFVLQQVKKYRSYLENVRQVSIIVEYCDVGMSVVAISSIALATIGFSFLVFSVAALGGLVGFILAFLVIELMLWTLGNLFDGWIAACRRR